MKGTGIFLIIIGGLGLLFALLAETSVPSGIGRIENLGALSRQSTGQIVSAILFSTGWILVALAGVRNAMDRVGAQIAATLQRAAAQAPAAAEPARQTRTAPSTSAADATRSYQARYDQASAHGSDTSVAEVISVAAHGGKAFRIGDRVHHQSFGLGTVKAIDGENASVKFDGRPAEMPMLVRYLQRA